MSKSLPSEHLLSEYASLEAWTLAKREAARSPLRKFKTGAVLLSKKGEIISSGCSHYEYAKTTLATVHAETHCLRRTRIDDLRKATMLLFTYNSNCSGSPRLSTPCRACAAHLVRRGIGTVIYPIKRNGSWEIFTDTLEDVDCSKALHMRNSHLFEHPQVFSRSNRRELASQLK